MRVCESVCVCAIVCACGIKGMSGVAVAFFLKKELGVGKKNQSYGRWNRSWRRDDWRPLEGGEGERLFRSDKDNISHLLGL